MDTFRHLGLALAIGFLIGVERGWRARDVAEGGRTAGIRTYALIGLLGGVTALLSQNIGGWAFAALGAPFAAAFVFFKQREQEAQDDHSVTDVVAALLVFALGAYAGFGGGEAAAAAAVVAAILLALKSALHGWLKHLTWPELRSALVLLAMTVVVLPLLPDRAIGPYGIVNPYELWLVTIGLAGVSFVAYAAIKIYGPKRGVVMASLAGALVSSTAVTLHLARLTREAPRSAMTYAGAALLAGAVMAARVAVIAGVLDPPLLPGLAPPLAAFAAVSAGLGAVAALRAGRREPTDAAIPMASPFDLGLVVKFAAILGAIFAASRVVQALYGAGGLIPIAALGGLADADAATVAVARSQAQGQAELQIAVYGVLIAAAVNSLVKAVIAGLIGGVRLGVLFAGATLLAMAAAAAVLLAMGPGLAG